jgi:hypothetical protein
MKTFNDLKFNDTAWIIEDNFNVYEVTLTSKDICEGFNSNIIIYKFCDICFNETIVSLYESANESDKNWAYCNGGKIYLDKEPILKKLEDKLKDINDMINYIKLY